MPAWRRLLSSALVFPLLAACSDDDGPEPVGIMWGSGASGAFVGDTISLVAFYRDAAGDPIGLPRPPVTWASSQPSILAIISESLALALDTGRAVLTAMTTEGPAYTAQVPFEIIPPMQGRLVWARSVSGGQPALFMRHLPERVIQRLPEFGYPDQGHGDPYMNSVGSRVAAIGTRPVAPAAPSTVFVVDLVDSSVVAPFEAMPGNQIAPVWMLGDSLIAFLSNQAGSWEVFTGRLDGSGVTQRTQLGQSVPPFFDVTPDGNLVLPLRPPAELYEMTLAGDTIRRLTTRVGQEGFPSVRPDGLMIAFGAEGGGVWIMNRDGNSPRPLLPERRIPFSSRTTLPATSGHPSWSADGQFVLLQWTIDPWWDGQTYIPQPEVYAIRLADGLAIRLTRSPGTDGQPVLR